MEILLKYFSDFTPVQLEQLSVLNELYTGWNSKINVISRKDIGGLYEKHILHSLSIAAAFNFPNGSHIIDIGTGGGFPGIPLAIYFPEVQFHLVDSIGKKLMVVQDIALKIGLKNVTVQHIRAEEISNRKFDFVVSRAVAPLKELWAWARPLLNKKEYQMEGPAELVKSGLIALKGGDLANEIAASGCRPRQIEIFELFPEEYFKEKYLLYVTK
jgi:16S rRNA (guanine527-N7)-methyltransferase